MALNILPKLLLLFLTAYSTDALRVPSGTLRRALFGRASPISSYGQASLNAIFNPAARNVSTAQLVADPVLANSTEAPTVMVVDASVGATVSVTCSAREHGGGLNPPACYNTLHYSPTGNVQESWGFKNLLPAGSVPDVALPVQVFSDDATCVIRPHLKIYTSNTLGHASAKEVSDAARAIIAKCVLPRRIGGTAVQIGGDNKVEVDVALFEPSVQCTGTVTTPPQSCEYIMADMFKDFMTEKFGIYSTQQPSVDVALPLVLKAPDGQCQITVDITGPQVKAKWNDVWQATGALVAKCVRSGSGGKSIVPAYPAGTGRQPPSELFVSVTDEPAPSGVSVVVEARSSSTGFATA